MESLALLLRDSGQEVINNIIIAENKQVVNPVTWPQAFTL